jgi:hypothetical protein
MMIMPDRQPIKHGTYGGYQTHKNRDDEPCDECLEANAAYRRKYRASTPRRMQRDRRENAARSRALWRLAAEYRARFRELVAEELRS